VPHVNRSNALDADNASVNYRVWLAGSDVPGKEYGTEVTRLVFGYALDTVGLHRQSLSVFDFNPRAASTRNAASNWKVAAAGRDRDGGHQGWCAGAVLDLPR